MSRQRSSCSTDFDAGGRGSTGRVSCRNRAGSTGPWHCRSTSGRCARASRGRCGSIVRRCRTGTIFHRGARYADIGSYAPELQAWAPVGSGERTAEIVGPALALPSVPVVRRQELEELRTGRTASTRLRVYSPMRQGLLGLSPLRECVSYMSNLLNTLHSLGVSALAENETSGSRRDCYGFPSAEGTVGAGCEDSCASDIEERDRIGRAIPHEI